MHRLFRGDTVPYRITYGEEDRYSVKPAEYSTLRIRCLTAAFLLVLALFAKFCWPEGAAVIRSVLLPSSPSVTQQAMDCCILQIQHGEPVVESFAVFCRQVLVDGTAK